MTLRSSTLREMDALLAAMPIVLSDVDAAPVSASSDEEEGDPIHVYLSWGDPEHEELAAAIRADPRGLGARRAQLWQVFHKRIYYRYGDPVSGRQHDFYIRFHVDCGKDKCNTAEHQRTLTSLVEWYDAHREEEDY
jgi:hypothetical protein